jgi:hypothetical protein
MLDDGLGGVRTELVGLLKALCSQQHPRSAIIWLRNPDVRRLLGGLAQSQLPLTHATFDAEPNRRTAAHLRGLLMRHGALPARDPVLTAFELWLHDTLPGYSPAAGRLLHGFATWHHLRRLRPLAAEGRLTSGSTHTAKQEITVAGHLLAHLETTGGPFFQTRQADLDDWLAAGPSTRHSARTFVVWAVQARHLPPLRFPHRRAQSTPVLAQDERLRLLATFLHQKEHPPWLRLAAVLLLLYAQPVTRIGHLHLTDIVERDGTLAIRFGTEPAELPPPIADLLRTHLAARANTNTAANTDSEWLFPGYRPGQPLHRSYLMSQIRGAGVHLLGGRNSALRQLVLDMPPAVAAQALGYSPQVAEAHARHAASTWASYAAYRSSQTHALSEPDREESAHGGE